jgi:hypothetical protein
VQELADQGVNAVKIWVDDRNGRVKKLTPDIYRPIIEEAHKHGLMAVAHVFYLKDAHELVDAGIDGFMHLVRDEVMDDRLIAKMKEKHVFADANIGGSRRAGLDEAPAAWLPLLAETAPAGVIEQYKATFVGRDAKAVAAAKATYERMAKSLAKLNAAGVTITFGGDTGIPGAWHGWAEQYGWGDASHLAPGGGTKVMPESLHGCFADYEDNIWIAGNSDGVVQKYSHDGKLLLQIGTKGVCDGKAPPVVAGAPSVFFPTCVSPGLNASKTLLNDPADIAVDPNPDPVTNERGSIYIADGYGNHRIVVFSNKGTYLRHWGSAGSGPGQFAAEGGGHPHCVTIGSVYTCDRGNARVEVFDRTGALKRTIAINPEGFSYQPLRTNDIAFSKDPGQTFFYTSDVGSGTVWILNRATGAIVAGIGSMGQQAGQFIGVHTMATDSKGNLYVSEGGGGRRTQKFVKQ